MANAYIGTNMLPRTTIAGSGELTEVLNDALCGRAHHVKRPGDSEAVSPGCAASRNGRVAL